MLSNMETGYEMQYSSTDYSIRGKAVLVLGDAAGIGRVLSGLLAESGATVFIATRSAAEQKRALAAVAQAGGKGSGVVLDLCQPEDVRRVFDQAESWLGRIDAVVNCLGENLEACQNLCTQEAISRMQAGSRGRIININPAGGMTGSPAERSLASALRRQASAFGIRVTLVEPGNTLHDPASAEAKSAIEDVARCVVDSLAQPFGMDVIFLQGRYQNQLH